MGGAYVWRAAILAAVVNMVLNPGVAWLGSLGSEFVPVVDFMLYVVLASITLTVLIAVFGAHRLHHEPRMGHRTPVHGGTAWERRLLARLPSTPWSFGLLLGTGIALAATLVLTVLRLLGFSGFSFATFSVFIACYTGALAFVSMRWTIVRQVMEPAPVG